MTTIPIDAVDIGQGRRAVSKSAVKALATSIAEVGLIVPVTVTQVGNAYPLVAGRHRLEAAKLLGWTEIAATILDLDRVDREIAEIDENLVRHDLTALERGRQLERRHDLYVQKHPETIRGTSGGKAGGRGRQKIANDTVSFAIDAAKKTGMSKRSVQRSISIAKKIPVDVQAALAGSAIAGSQGDLLAFASLPEDEQREVVETTDMTDREAVRRAVGARLPPLTVTWSCVSSTSDTERKETGAEPAPKPRHTTEVEVSVEAFARAILSLFDADERAALVALVTDNDEAAPVGAGAA